MKKFTLICVVLLCSIPFTGCEKQQQQTQQSEVQTVASAKSSLFKVDRAQFNALIKNNFSLIDNAIAKYNGESSEIILKQLLSKGRISENTYKTISAYNKQHDGSNNSISVNSELTTPPPVLTPIEQTDVMLYTVMTNKLLLSGMSWGCAAAIAGVGISIAGLFIGGPATVAAAALWGAGHILSVLSLTACGPKNSQTLVADSAALVSQIFGNKTQEEFIADVEADFDALLVTPEEPVAVP